MKIRIVAASLFGLSFFISLAAELNITYGIAMHQNRKPYQEDRFVYADMNGGKFFGVYDGHGGDKTSSFLKNSLHTYFQNCLGKSRKEQFEYAFAQAEEYALKNFDDGSTAVVAYIDKDNTLHCAWAGDSRAVLECDGKASFFTDDHKPSRADEKERIEKAGGKLYWHGVWRVNGLAVSRSIGDRKIKSKAGQVIATPEYAHIQLNSDNHFLIIASDGLWDVVGAQEAVAIVKEELADQNSVGDVAQILQSEAIASGSSDNITVCVVKFDW
jgi:protein phosphatase 1L